MKFSIVLCMASCLAVAAESSLKADSSAISRRKAQFLRQTLETRARRILALQGPDVQMSNTVYLGADNGESCDKSSNFVEDLMGNPVVYCFNVTNTGYTHLTDIRVTDDTLHFSNTSTSMLSPGESIVFFTSSSISASAANLAIVSANPVFPDGSAMVHGEVVDRDTSAVGERILLPYSAPGAVKPNNCVQDSWKDAAKTDQLLCTAKEVYLVEDSIKSEPMTCVAGDMIKVSLDAIIIAKTTRFDLGWYIAADGGNALEGTCVLNAFQEGNSYTVNDAAGYVAWDEEGYLPGHHINDKCGDLIVMDEDSGGVIDIPFAVAAPLRCTDANENGTMDLTVCFSWRLDYADEFCTLLDSDPDTTGRLPDLYPGDNSMCYCTTYEVPTITVVPRNTNIAPCR